MNKELKAYLRIETTLSAAFNYFIGGMAAALIYRKADTVSAAPVSIAIDLLITCLSVFILTALFSNASLKHSKTAGMFVPERWLIKTWAGLIRRPLLFGTAAGLTAAVILTALTAPLFALLNISEIPFWIYIAVKPVFNAFLGGGATRLELYSGMYSNKL
jgi:hypothetical protein